MDRMSSIEFAIQNEHSEMGYYLEQAKRSKNDVVKLLFETLAADEKEHMNQIRALHEELTARGTWPEEVAIEIKGTAIAERVDELKRDKARASAHDDDDITALKKSAEAEARGAEFYTDLAGKCDNPKEREFFRFLANIEREHFASIRDSIFYLEDPEAWFEENSRAGMDGG